MSIEHRITKVKKNVFVGFERPCIATNFSIERGKGKQFASFSISE